MTGALIALFLAQMPGMTAMENSVGFIASGTSIEPRTVSEFAPVVHGYVGSWSVMFHANGFLVGTQASGPRGAAKLFSTNWLMPMISRDFGRQTIALRTMLSLEPITVTERRYPELFQTGETAYGIPIVDGQHPHNFFMEVSGRYNFRATERTTLYIYGGPVAEPALGPTAYPHRPSASEDPVAVLGHRQQDSTHISFNVITTGFIRGLIQVEASHSTGANREKNRWT